jgi:hypothetical protein
MKKFPVSIAFALALGAVTLAQTSPTVAPDQSNEKVDKLFAQWDKPDSPGCALKPGEKASYSNSKLLASGRDCAACEQ